MWQTRYGAELYLNAAKCVQSFIHTGHNMTHQKNDGFKASVIGCISSAFWEWVSFSLTCLPAKGHKRPYCQQGTDAYTKLLHIIIYSILWVVYTLFQRSGYYSNHWPKSGAIILFEFNLNWKVCKQERGKSRKIFVYICHSHCLKIPFCEIMFSDSN